MSRIGTQTVTAGRQPWRSAARRIHLWLGLTIGLLFAVISLTGSALVFYVGIDAALHPETQVEQRAPAPGWTSPVWDRALATARAARFDPAGKWSFEVTGGGGAIPARYYPPTSSTVRHPQRLMVWFSADGSRILRVAPWGGYLMSWLYELHMHLLAGNVGAQVVGWSGVIMLVLLLSGLIAWWPRGSWRKALAFRRNAPPIRRLNDIHRLVGVGSGGLLLILVASGVILALPAVKAALLSPATVPEPPAIAGSGPALPIRRALAGVRAAVPDARLAFIDVPGDPAVPYRVRIQVPNDPHRRFPGSYVFVDQRSARIVALHNVRDGGLGTAINTWVRPLHDGSVGGLVGRIVAVLVGLAPAALFVTGLLRWQRRRGRWADPAR
ncbi:PepSY domain-containing protein [uncultured Sphingomonas sp.]|uniref:PepSY-associated TM helix domain-containing protein n=1 Tax=uncultured Sphingomonas sp. TaxID=158754 RepID=UPI0025DC4D3B|nr:PepSY-associated TM helix domain-containing protein [uncultured Sphingomonas sp.]